MQSPSNKSTQTTSPTATVILFGKIGHGKTCILNTICQESFDSHMSSQSCTRTLQIGKSRHFGMVVIDTPGFYATEDVEQHTRYQTQAIAKTGELSGIYVIVKYARCSDMAETVNRIMDFVGDDGEEYIRVIVTHVDTVEKEELNTEETKATLSHLLDIPPHHIALTGNAKHDDVTTDGESSASSIEEFIHSTLHLQPRRFQVSNEQLGCISNLCVGARKFKQAIEEVNGKLRAATVACQTLMVSSSSLSQADEGNIDFSSCRNPSRHAFFAIHLTRQVTKSMVHDARNQLNLQGGRELTPEEYKILSAKLDFLLSVSLEMFLDETSLKCGSFHSKKQHCYPSLDITYRKAIISKDGDDWEIVYNLSGEEIPVSNVAMRLKENDLNPTALQEKRSSSQDGNTMAKKQKTSHVVRPDDLLSFGNRSVHRVPSVDDGIDNIFSGTPSRQKKSLCTRPDDLPTFGDSNVHNVQSDNDGIDMIKISSCTLSRQNMTSCSKPGNLSSFQDSDVHNVPSVNDGIDKIKISSGTPSNQNKSSCTRPDDLATFGDSNIHNTPSDDDGIDMIKISSCTPSRQNMTSCSKPGNLSSFWDSDVHNAPSVDDGIDEIKISSGTPSNQNKSSCTRPDDLATFGDSNIHNAPSDYDRIDMIKISSCTLSRQNMTSCSRPDDLPSFRDSKNVHNAPSDDNNISNEPNGDDGKISSCTPLRLNQSSCANPGRGTANNEESPVPTSWLCCHCLINTFSFLFIEERPSPWIVVRGSDDAVEPLDEVEVCYEC